jgi:hypothetical protein
LNIVRTAEDDFKKWFVNSLEPLREDPNAGFIFALVAFSTPVKDMILADFAAFEGDNLFTHYRRITC